MCQFFDDVSIIGPILPSSVVGIGLSVIGLGSGVSSFPVGSGWGLSIKNVIQEEVETL